MYNTITKKSYKRDYDSKTTSVHRKNMTEGNTYIFKIRAYNIVKGKRVYSPYSKGKKLSTHIKSEPTGIKGLGKKIHL